MPLKFKHGDIVDVRGNGRVPSCKGGKIVGYTDSGYYKVRGFWDYNGLRAYKYSSNDDALVHMTNEAFRDRISKGAIDGLDNWY